MNDSTGSRIERRLQAGARGCVAAAALAAAVVLWGWTAGIQWLGNFGYGIVRARPIAAFYVLLIATAVWTAASRRRRFATLLAGTTALLASFSGCLQLSGSPYLEPINTTGMAAVSALLLAAAVLLSLHGWRATSAAFALVGALLPLVELIAYTFEAERTITAGLVEPMSFPSACILLVLALGIFLMSAGTGWTAPLVSTGAGGVVLRLLLPGTVVLPWIVAWSAYQGRNAAVLPYPVAASLAGILTSALFIGVLLWTAFVLDRVDEQRLRASQEAVERAREAETERARLNATFSSISEGLYRLDANALVEYLNPAAEELLGYRTAELSGRSMHDAIHAELPDGTHRESNDCPLVHVIQTGVPYREEDDYFRRRDGTFIRVEFSSSPILLKGQVAGAVVSFRDIGPRKQMEAELRASLRREQAARREADSRKVALELLNSELETRVRQRTASLEAANKELETFAYSVSHDLRTPLRTVEGFSHILVEEYADKLDEEGRDLLRRIQAAGVHLGQLIDAILQLSRVSRAELNSETVNLGVLANRIFQEMVIAEPGRNVRLEVEAGLHANGDPRLLEILLRNLLGNAWKFTRRTVNPVIRFTATTRDGAETYCVADNGAGFDPRFSHKLFQPFQRLHAETEFQGTGVGLATVKRIAMRHGGQVWAQSSPGSGASFFFTLGHTETPYEQQDHPAGGRQPRPRTLDDPCAQQCALDQRG